VRVEGTSADLRPLVRKTVGIRRGSLYSPNTIDHAEERLRLLELFSQVRFELEPYRGDTLDVLVVVSERDAQRLEIGGGYWTDDQLKGRALWTHRNLLRRGRGLQTRGSYSRFEQEVSASTWWPAMIGARIRGQVTGSLRREDEDAYLMRTVEIEPALIYRPTLKSTVTAGLSVASIDLTIRTVLPEGFEFEDGALAYLFARWIRDGTDNRLDPRQGRATQLRTEWSPVWFPGVNHYALVEAIHSIYVPLPRGVVGAAKVEGGYARPLGTSLELLPKKRFFMGGAKSMRGFRRRELGPVSPEGDPLGGEVRLGTSVEARIPIVWKLWGAVFADAGQVWLTRGEVALSDLEVAVGPGLMIETPVGPIRADVGFRVTDVVPDEPRHAYHLSIGHPF
jgi:outer membrane translocation and assembly module TamA